MYRVLTAAFILPAAVLAGCAVLPEYREEPLTTADVIRHIKCELRDAAWRYPQNQWIRDWTVGLVFELKANHAGGLDANSETWTFPLNHGAIFAVAVNGGFNGAATRTERISFKVGLNEINSQGLACLDEESGRYALLGGRLGIADLFERAGQTMQAAKVVEERFTSLNYNLQFVIKKNAGVTPRFSLIPIGKEKTFSGPLAWSGSREDTQGVEITLTPPVRQARCRVSPEPGKPWPDDDACPSAVYVVSVRHSCWTLKKDDCGTQTDCEWDSAKSACVEKKETHVTRSWAKRDPAQSVPQPKRAVTPADEQRNSGQELLNALRNLPR